MIRLSFSVLLFVLSWAPAAAVDEAAARRYALERLAVRDLRSPAAGLQAELERDILRFLDLAERSGRPGPAYFEIGVIGSYLLWGNPGETAYVMAEALPYLSPAAQGRVRAFLASMVRAADPTEVAFEHCGGWGACELRPPRREFYLLPMPPDPQPLRPNIWPPPAVPAETIYMLWRYADSTGDWDFISSSRPPSGARWQRLRNLFQAIPSTPTRYGEIAGAIGWLRLLERFGLTGDSTYAEALAKIRAGLAAGNPFSRFLDAANRRFIGPHHHDWSFPPFHWHRDQNAIGIFFAPEIGRFLADYSLEDVRRRVSFNPREGQPGEPNAIEAHWPEWFLYRGEYPPTEKWTSHYGENHMVTPDVPWALFMIHAYVYNEPGEQLSAYLDVPYSIGDLCHWQRLVATIQSYGVKAWVFLSGGAPPANRPPTVALTAPANGASFVAPATVDLTATASDPDGSVARVEFLINGTVVASVATAPYAYRATFTTAGSYQLAARAFDNQGASATSAIVQITVQAPPADTTPPSVPQGLTATALSAGSVRLSWQPSTDNVGVAGYEVERNGSVLPGAVPTTEFTDTGLSASTSYTYRVRAADAAGNRSGWSAPATVTTPGSGTTPPQVTNLLANGGFETGNFEGWDNEWGFEIAAASAHTGRFGARMVGDGRLTQVFSTVSGRRYYVMARVRIDRQIAAPAWGGVRVQITSYDWNELAVATLTLENAPQGAWRRVDLSFVAASNRTRVAFENFSGGGRWEASGDEFYVSETPIPPDGEPPANRPPTVALTAPAGGASFVAPATVDLRATASDPDGSVVRVEFLVNGAVVATVATAPYTYRATFTTTGSYTLTARAVDNLGASALSAPVSITVTAPPAGGGGGGGGGGAPPSGLLANGGFETGNLDGWSGSGQVTQADRRSGQWSVLLTTGSISQVINTTPGQKYKLTGWARVASQSGSDWGGFRFEVQSYDWKTLAHSGYITLESAGNGWTKYALSFTPTTSQTRIHVGFFGGPGLRMSVYADELAVFAVTGAGLPPNLTPVIEVSQANGQTVLRYRVDGDDPDGAVVRFNWDFGDGARSQWPAGTRRAGLPGQFTAVFRASDDDGNVVTRRVPWSVPTPPGYPSITITEPAEGATVSSPDLVVRGQAAGAVGEILLSTDRDTMAQAPASSAWSATIALRPGWNRILVQARDAARRIVTAERRVRYVPTTALAVTDITEHGPRERWEPLEIRFRIAGSAATHPQFPYDPRPPRGLEFVDGISVEALFTRDNWTTVLRRPGFLQQRYERALKSNEEWMYPTGEPVWTVRFAPPETGTWQYRIEVREARGTAQSAVRSFTASRPSNSLNRGPVRVSSRDSRYFEYADGTPFLGGGSGIGSDTHRYSFDLIEKLNQVGSGNQTMFRWWISGHIWGSAWAPWTSRTLPYEGTVPASGLSLESAWADGLAALLLDSRNPLMFQGFAASHPSLVPGRRYRVRVRWRTEGVTGPQRAGQPFGVCLKFVGWPEPGQTADLPVLIPHVAGDTPWHLAYADFTANSDLLPNLAVILENTTGGRAFVDEIALHELLAGGTLGPQLMLTPRFNSHLSFDPRRSAAMDVILQEAARLGITLRLVISEKQEFLLNHLGADGLADRNPGNFNNEAGSPNRWLHEAWWRYLFARFGAYRSIHSWELVNEEAPGPTSHFRLAARLAELAARDGNPHPATTSTWATFAEEAWKAPFSAPISNVDFHVYVRAGWIEPREELANDSARFFAEYDRASLAIRWGKPATWGEQGINAPGDTDSEDPGLRSDRQGIWLHKMIWARCGPGGVYPLYWYTDNIFDYRLHRLYGNWNRFMAGIPLNNGRYVDAAARSSNPDLRAFGQKDTSAGRAHLWIDNRRHTWRAVVDGLPIPAVSGTVTIPMSSPGVTYRATWYNTYTGSSVRTESVTANAAGEVTLRVQNLATDTAVRLQRQ